MREITKSLWIPLSLVLCIGPITAAGCVGDDDPAGGVTYDAASADADPTAPDADPGSGGVPDADPGDSPDANPDTSDNAGVACGDTMTCTGDDVCCVTFGGGGINTACTTSADCQSSGGTASACDGPEDCSGSNVCCGGISGSSCGTPGPQCTVLCHKQSDCAAGEMCCEVFGGIMACQATCFGGP